MRSTRHVIAIVVAVATAVALFTVVGTSAALAAETHNLTGQKDCNNTPSPPDPGGFCRLTQSNLPILVGAKVYYTNPDPAALGAGILSSPVTLKTAGEDQSTASGHCTFVIATVLGLCIFAGGTEELTGFHMTMLVVGVIPDTSVYALTGTYFFDRHIQTHDLSGQKECRPPASLITPPAPGGYCVLTQSNLGILVNARAFYTAATLTPHAGPGGANVLDSPILLKATDGSTANGHCTYYFPTATGSGHGLCLYSRGTGDLRGFHATIMVGPPIRPGVFAINGTYWFGHGHDGENDD